MTDTKFEQAVMNTNEIELTTTGRVTGRAISHPVWFVRKGTKLFLLPVVGADSQWYKNVLKTPTIRLAADGAQSTGQATPITDPDKVQEVVESFRAKYGAGDVEAHYSKLDVAVEIAPM